MKLYTCVYESCEVRIGPKSTLKFANFVKPKTDLVRAIRWVSLTGRSDFKTKDIDRFTVICEQHFPQGVDLDWKTNKSLEPFQYVRETPPLEPELKLTHQANVRTYESIQRRKKILTIPVGHAIQMGSLDDITFKGNIAILFIFDREHTMRMRKQAS